MEKRTDSAVADYMSRDLTTLSPKDGILEALMITCSADLRHVPILEGGKLVGIVSDRDIKRALPTPNKGAWEDGWKGLEDQKLDAIMSKNVLTIASDADLRDAAAVMMREKVSALPVVDDGALVGIITTEDILWAYLSEA